MRIYKFLSKVPVAKRKYSLKFFIITLPLIIIPLAELAIFNMVLNGRIKILLPAFFLIAAVVTVLAATGILYLFNKLLSPLLLAQKALNNYIAFREIPHLPEEFEDEAGILLNNIQTTITKLDSLLSEKSDMIDLLSHDLRSPVARIISLSNLIKVDSETNKDLYADYITNECKGLLRLLENILLMLKEDGHVFKLVNVNLKHLITETVKFFEFPAAEKNLQINMSVDDDVYVNVQQDLFTQAVRNIIGNAIKFSSDGKAINIFAHQDNDEAHLSIQDEGIGFVNSEIKKIFERFTNSGKKGTHGEASVGLGLYLSKKIIEKHGGKLTAESEGVNKGATFTITLYRLVIKKRQSKLHDNRGKLEFFKV
jgi:signal transduction histidine kinase